MAIASNLLEGWRSFSSVNEACTTSSAEGLPLFVTVPCLRLTALTAGSLRHQVSRLRRDMVLCQRGHARRVISPRTSPRRRAGPHLRWPRRPPSRDRLRVRPIRPPSRYLRVTASGCQARPTQEYSDQLHVPDARVRKDVQRVDMCSLDYPRNSKRGTWEALGVHHK